MEHTATFSLVVPGRTRSFADDNWQETEAAYIHAWKSAVPLLLERKVSFEGISYRVRIDWMPLLRCHERHYSAMAYLSRGGSKDFGYRIRRARFPQRPVKILVTAQSDAKEEKHLESVAESVIHDAFLIMNISAPGCCNFYGARLVGQESTSEISLSSSEFELCILPSRQSRPSVRFLPISKVVTWYEAVRPTAGQIPTSSTERMIFALLHLAKLDGETLSVIWLFYALESLLQTKVGENFGSEGGEHSRLPHCRVGKVGTMGDARPRTVNGGAVSA
jgi:hypothetical protein